MYYLKNIDFSFVKMVQNTKNSLDFYKQHWNAIYGVDFACKNQQFNHIPGTAVLVRQNLFNQRLQTFEDTFKDNTKCFDVNKFMLPTYSLGNVQDCLDVKQILSLEEKQKTGNKQYNFSDYEWIVKHATFPHGQGVFQINGNFGNKMYSYIQKINCTSAPSQILNYESTRYKEKQIVRKKLDNPLLVEDEIVDLRVYIYIQSVEPFQVYFAPKASHTLLSEWETDRSMNSREKTPWLKTWQEFLDYLRSKKYTDEEIIWLEGNLKFKTMQALLIAKSDLVHFDNAYEVFAVDFTVDVKLNIYFLQMHRSSLAQNLRDMRQQFQQNLHDLLQEVIQERNAKLQKKSYKLNQDILKSMGSLNEMIEAVFDGDAVCKQKYQKIQKDYNINKKNYQLDPMVQAYNDYKNLKQDAGTKYEIHLNEQLFDYNW